MCLGHVQLGFGAVPDTPTPGSVETSKKTSQGRALSSDCTIILRRFRHPLPSCTLPLIFARLHTPRP